MTQDEIIELAEQAGMTQDGDMWFSNGKEDMDVEHKHLVAFANLVAAKALAQRTWVGLTDKERETATGWSVEHIENFLKEKNDHAEEKT